MQVGGDQKKKKIPEKIKRVWNYAHRIDTSLHWNISNSWVKKDRNFFQWLHPLIFKWKYTLPVELFPDVLKLKTKPSNIIVIISGLLSANSSFKEYLFLGIH